MPNLRSEKLIPFVPKAPFLYPLKTSESRTVDVRKWVDEFRPYLLILTGFLKMLVCVRNCILQF